MEFHEVASIFPLMEAAELQELADDIGENGLLEPIWTHDGKIVDGRNRYLACQMTEPHVEPRYQEWEGSGSLVSFVVSLNLKRRHLTAVQRAAVATDILPMLEVEARERQATGAPGVLGGLPLSQKVDGGVGGRSAEQAADLLGTNRQYVYDAERIKESAPDVFEEMRAGTLSMPQARALAALPAEDRAVVQEAADTHGWSKTQTVEVARELTDERIPGWHKEKVLAGEADPVAVAPNGMFALSTATVGRAMRDERRGGRAERDGGAGGGTRRRGSVMDKRFMVAAILVAGGLDCAANWLAAHYLVPIGPWLVPGGTFLFALAFTTYDYLRRFGGLRPTLCAILLGLAASLAYNALWGGGVGRIALAGLAALACSSLTDLLMQSLTLRWPIWRYVLASNAVSLLVDSAVFAALAFAALPPEVRVQIAEGQYVVKVAMTLVSIPLIYEVRAWSQKQSPSVAA